MKPEFWFGKSSVQHKMAMWGLKREEGREVKVLYCPNCYEDRDFVIADTFICIGCKSSFELRLFKHGKESGIRLVEG